MRWSLAQNVVRSGLQHAAFIGNLLISILSAETH
jgi:hypothetical protein